MQDCPANGWVTEEDQEEDVFFPDRVYDCQKSTDRKNEVFDEYMHVRVRQ